MARRSFGSMWDRRLGFQAILAAGKSNQLRPDPKHGLPWATHLCGVRPRAP